MTNSPLKYQTGLRRLGAAIIDTLVFIPLVIADNYVLGHLENKIGLILWLTFMTGVTVAYAVVMHHKYGQTLGKMAVKVKVVTLDETKYLTIKQALLRDSFYIVLEAAGLLYFAVEIISADVWSTDLADGYYDFVGAVAFGWVLLELVSMLTNKKRRAIHDFIAGSVVIRTGNG